MYITISIVVAVVFGMFKSFIQHKERTDIDEALLAKNKRKYYRYEALSAFPFILFTAVLIFLVYQLGSTLMEMLSANEEYRFLFVTDSVSWILPGFILGFGLVIIPLEQLYRYLLKDEYILYLEALNRKHGWDGMKVVKPICKFLILVGAFCFVLLLNVSVAVTDNSICINSFFSLSGTEYSLDEVDEIAYYDSYVAPNGDVSYQERIVFYSDGKEILDTEMAFLNINPEKVLSMVQFIEKKNQIKVQEKGAYQ